MRFKISTIFKDAACKKGSNVSIVYTVGVRMHQIFNYEIEIMTIQNTQDIYFEVQSDGIGSCMDVLEDVGMGEYSFKNIFNYNF